MYFFVNTVEIDGIKVRGKGVEKTIVDCFEFRNKIGIGVALRHLMLAVPSD